MQPATKLKGNNRFKDGVRNSREAFDAFVFNIRRFVVILSTNLVFVSSGALSIEFSKTQEHNQNLTVFRRIEG